MCTRQCVMKFSSPTTLRMYSADSRSSLSRLSIHDEPSAGSLGFIEVSEIWSLASVIGLESSYLLLDLRTLAAAIGHEDNVRPTVRAVIPTGRSILVVELHPPRRLEPVLGIELRQEAVERIKRRGAF